jgi:uncharacterized protein YdeI (YjbR/CyaY-like superfamily)
MSDPGKPRLFKTQADWAAWLERNHAKSDGVWLKFAKKRSGKTSVSYDEALDVALCYGWIDSQTKAFDDSYTAQRWTPRRAKSIWSKRNREKAEALIRSRKMRPAGKAAIEAAKKDGRWDAAYDSPSRATVPEDLQAALDKNKRAKAFFATLDSRNRYAILFRTHNAKKPETRARRIEQFVAMLARKEKLYP